jgi:alkylation response protein AidB-like acyl-CoA dehydrogenase
VRVPLERRVGPENAGWSLLKATIGHERVLVADVGRCKTMLRRLRRIAALERREGRSLAEDPRFVARLARLEIRLKALELCALRVVNDPALAVRPEASLLKVRGTELQQELSRATSDALGLYALPYHPEVLSEGWRDEPVGPDYAATPTPFYFFWRKASISAGTNEIQRTIIAKSLLS